MLEFKIKFTLLTISIQDQGIIQYKHQYHNTMDQYNWMKKIIKNFLLTRLHNMYIN